jgi:hypothetical protein
MQARLGRRVFILVVLCVVVIPLTWFHQSRAEGVGSITVDLPPAHSAPGPGFKF